MKAPPATSELAREVLVATLRREVGKLERLRFPADDRLLSTGAAALDRLLPGGGLAPGSLVEYLSPGPGSAAGTLALAAAREACQDGRALVVLDRQGTFYPPAAAAWGIDVERLLILRPSDAAGEVWALDQALRCPGVGAVWAPLGGLDVRDFRRLQLAAEAGGTLGLFVRPAQLRGQPSWAEVQFEITVPWEVGPPQVGQASSLPRNWQSLRQSHPHPNPLPKGEGTAAPLRTGVWRLRVELVRCRGGPGGGGVTLEFNESTGLWQEVRADHATHSVSAPAQLAPAATARRA